MTNCESYYLDCFRVGREELDTLVATALEKGGDFADLYFEYTTYTDMMLKDGAVTSGGHHVDYGVGIRVLKGEKTGYAYAENTNMRDMMDAARTAALIARSGGESLPYKAGSSMRSADFYPCVRPWRDVSSAEFLPLLRRFETLVRSKDSRIDKVIAKISWSQSDVLMYNSFHELCCDSRPMASLAASVIFIQGERKEIKNVSRSFRMGAEMMTEALLEELAEDAVRGMDARFEARRPKGGQMPVVMGAGASGILLHEAMGHAFEADFNRKGQSIFAGMMGKKVCDNQISIVDDATLCANRGACNYDDEGVPGQKTYMVRDGVLTSYLHDRISAAWYGVAPTGNGRREDFRFNPVPRMRATYMESGNAEPEDIVRSVRKGIYVDDFSNGQVKIGEGDFTFYVQSGFLIEDGRLTMPVKDINIIGNGPEALRGISMVGNDSKIDNGTWTCGKEQNVAVSCGIPTVLVDKLTVGGRE